jgi:hypothetical protein
VTKREALECYIAFWASVVIASVHGASGSIVFTTVWFVFAVAILSARLLLPVKTDPPDRLIDEIMRITTPAAHESSWPVIRRDLRKLLEG